MPNIENLKPVRSKEEAKILGRKGGIASGVARREIRDLREALADSLGIVMENDKTVGENIIGAILNKALTGDIRAFTAIADRVEGKPLQPITEKPEDGLANLAESLREGIRAYNEQLKAEREAKKRGEA